jgi:DNA-binding beta-propeller fold protein YncE
MNLIQLALLGMALTPIASMAAGASVTYSVQHRYALGGEGKWDYLKLDAAARRLYITRSDRVMVMDVDRGTLIGEVPGAVGAHGIALVPSLHRGYVSNGHGDSLTPFDLVTLKSLPVIAVSGKDPDALIFDEASADLWAFNGHSSTGSVIDPSTEKEVATVSLPGKPEFAVTDHAGHIYVNLEDVAKIAEIDAQTHKVLAAWSLAPCEGPTGLAIDTEHHRLFSVCANRKMVVTDANDGRQVATLPIGSDPDAAGYDSKTHTAYSSNRDGTLTVIDQADADHYTVAADVPTQQGARTLAIDDKTHRVFLAAASVKAPASEPAGKALFGVLVVGTP